MVRVNTGLMGFVFGKTRVKPIDFNSRCINYCLKTVHLLLSHVPKMTSIVFIEHRMTSNITKICMVISENEF